MYDLNLLPQKARFGTNYLHWALLIRPWVIGFWILLGLAGLVSGGWWWWQSGRLEQMKEKLAIAEKQYQQMSELVEEISDLNRLTGVAQGILDQRYSYTGGFRSVRNLFGQGVILDQIESRNQGEFMVSGRLSSPEDLRLLEKFIIEGKYEDEEGNVSLKTDLERMEWRNGVWLFDLRVAN